MDKHEPTRTDDSNDGGGVDDPLDAETGVQPAEPQAVGDGDPLADPLTEEAGDPLADPLTEEAGDPPADPLTEALAEKALIQDRYLRLQAEWDNYRKRTSQEREAERRQASAQLIERLLPVIDDMERAIEHSQNASTESMAEGVSAVTAKLLDILAFDGLTAVNPKGEAFDINLHQAVARIEDDTLYDETVAQVFQKGYQLNGKILRPAMVAVSSGGPPLPPDDIDCEPQDSDSGEPDG